MRGTRQTILLLELFSIFSSIVLLNHVGVANAADTPELIAAKGIAPWVVSLRQELHKIPEIAYEEVKTSAFIRKTLDEIGVKYTYPYAVTGIVAEIGRGSPVVALRADFDALAMDETADVAFKSEHEGRMHACGHDAHTSMLLGAAKLLKERESTLKGTVRLIFQPAEEGGAGGKRMRDEGALGAAGAIFALHVTPGFGGKALPLGHLSTNPGTVLAAAGTFDIKVIGRGGHAAAPHQTSDPIVASSAIVQALQPIVSRRLDPLESGVVSVTYIHAGNTNNVIPAEVALGGTFRSLTHTTFKWLRNEVETIATAAALAYGCTIEIDFREGKTHTTSNGDTWQDFPYPPTVNSAELLEFAMRAAAPVVGAEALHFDEKPVMGGEDFAFYAEEIPGFFAFIGHHAVGCEAPNHSPKFKVQEEVLPIGTALHVTFATQWLEENAQGNSSKRVEL